MTHHRLSSKKTTPQTRTTPAQPHAAKKIGIWQKMARIGWPFWVVIIMMSFGLIGYAATSTLLKMNNYENCDSIFWPLASGSMRLYCAQEAAKEGDPENLLQAISLVSDLPEDHALRDELDNKIKIWSRQVLDAAEKKFQQGNFEAAVEIAQKIPSSAAAQEVINQKLEKWRSIWEKGEAIEQAVKEKIKEEKWNPAFDEAGKLVDLNNQYLANQRYKKLMNLIEKAKADAQKLEKARTVFEQGGVDNLLTALEKAQEIEKDSYSYQEAQELVTDVGNALMAKAYNSLENQNWDRVLEIADAIPASLDQQQQVSDLRTIALAGSNAERGTVESLESAIAQLEDFSDDRPLYDKAQRLISRWKTEVSDLKIIRQAKEQAEGGKITDFREAIATAQNIPSGNPRYGQARELISEWTNQIERIQDRPILNRAQELARGGGVSDYEAAIAVANKIDKGRALYPEARRKIRVWRDRKQRIEDRPILLEAERLANKGRLQAAIKKAQEISQGRALYQQAQADINRWRTDLNARESIEKAYDIADAGTVRALTRAIKTVASARNSDNYRSQAQNLMNDWSEQLYQIATREARRGQLEDAIWIARKIPSYTSAASKARNRIQQWQQQQQQRRERQQQQQQRREQQQQSNNQNNQSNQQQQQNQNQTQQNEEQEDDGLLSDEKVERILD